MSEDIYYAISDLTNTISKRPDYEAVRVLSDTEKESKISWLLLRLSSNVSYNQEFPNRKGQELDPRKFPYVLFVNDINDYHDARNMYTGFKFCETDVQAVQWVLDEIGKWRAGVDDEMSPEQAREINRYEMWGDNPPGAIR